MQSRPRWFFYIVKPLLNACLRILFNIKIEGWENLPREPYIMVSNHLSWIDPIVYVGLWPIAPKLVFIANAATSVKNPTAKFLIGLADNPLVPFDKRDRKSRLNALRSMLKHAEAGRNVCFFPEGRIGMEGKMCPFHSGAFALSKRLNHLVVPVGLAGTYNLYWRRPIRIRIGRPIAPQENETIEEMTIKAHEVMRSLIPPYPGDLPEPHRLSSLATMFRVEHHPFVFDGKQALYKEGDPDGYDPV
jgi:1-acyl-sn-glycerol-3-phosphate acyltransferase